MDKNFETKEHRVKVGLAEMLKGGVIMDVTNSEQARIAEEAGAQAVMALERVPADIRRDGGVARMSDPQMIEEIKACVSIQAVEGPIVLNQCCQENGDCCEIYDTCGMRNFWQRQQVAYVEQLRSETMDRYEGTETSEVAVASAVTASTAG